jgi:hypothetical protein
MVKKIPKPDSKYIKRTNGGAKIKTVKELGI